MDHLWLPFLDQLQSDVVIIVIIYFQMYTNLVTERKHGISTNDIITFNESLEKISTEIIELTNISKYSHEKALVVFKTSTDLVNMKTQVL